MPTEFKKRFHWTIREMRLYDLKRGPRKSNLSKMIKEFIKGGGFILKRSGDRVQVI